MEKYFEDSAYLSAVIGTDSRFENEHEILDYVKDHHHFQIGSVSPKHFSEKYTSKGWIGRKVIALPAALWSAVVVATLHVFRAIFTATWNRDIYLKLCRYRVVRDYQEAWGRLSALFNDRYGSYHIQEGQFHKRCYDFYGAFLGSWRNSSTLKFGVWVDDEASKITLYKLKEMSEDNRDHWITKYTIDQKTCSQLFEKDDKTLQLITLEDLIIPKERSKILYALMSEDAFDALTLNDLPENLTEQQFFFIRERLKPPEEDGKNQEINKLPLRNLTEITAKTIALKKDAIPPLGFAFFASRQVKDLKLADLTKQQNNALFAFSGKKIKSKLLLFDPADIGSAVQKQVLSIHFLKHLTPSFFQYIDPTKLSAAQLELIFSKKRLSDQDRQKFAYFSPEQVNEMMINGMLTTKYQCGLLSDKQMQALELSKLLEEDIHLIFDGKRQQRFRLLKGSEVQLAYEQEKLSPSLIELITEEQIKTFDFSRCTQDFINFFFPPHSVEYLKKRYSETTYQIPPKQGGGEDHLKNISQKLSQQNLTLLLSLTIDQRNDLRKKLTEDNLELISS